MKSFSPHAIGFRPSRRRAEQALIEIKWRMEVSVNAVRAETLMCPAAVRCCLKPGPVQSHRYASLFCLLGLLDLRMSQRARQLQGLGDKLRVFCRRTIVQNIAAILFESGSISRKQNLKVHKSCTIHVLQTEPGSSPLITGYPPHRSHSIETHIMWATN